MIFLGVRPLVAIHPAVLQLAASPGIVIMLAELLSDRVQIVVQVDAVGVDWLWVVLRLIWALKYELIKLLIQPGTCKNLRPQLVFHTSHRLCSLINCSQEVKHSRWQ